jgi:hypothetical protein
MATFDRTTIVRGPCKITYDGATFYSKGGVTLTMNQSTFDKEVDGYGMVGKAKTDMQIVVEFEPVGEVEALAILFPFANTAIGSSIYGASDKPLVIVALDQTYTIHNAAITKLPSLRCTANNTQLGSVQFTGLVKNSANPNALTSYYTASAGAAIGIAFDPALIIAAPYTATLGASSFSSSDGFEISFDLALTPIVVDGIGTVSMALGNIGATVSCTPIGVATGFFDTYFDAMDAGKELPSATLDISTTVVGGLNFDASAVQVISIDRMFSPTENRLGKLTLAAKRTFTTGVPNALFTIAAVA